MFGSRPTPAENFQRVVNGINFDGDDVCKVRSLDAGNKIPQKTWELLTEYIGFAVVDWVNSRIIGLRT